MTDLAIGTLRLRGVPPGAVPDPQPLLDAVAPRTEDRRVLIVRRLDVPLADPHEARDRLEQVRRRAARPVTGPVPDDAEAVQFADEAEALLCLSRDVLAGVAPTHWWWAGRLPAYCPTPGEALAALWTRQPRWVPAVLAGLADGGPEEPRRVLRQLGSALAWVLAAVRAEYPAVRPVPTPAPPGVDPPTPSVGGDRGRPATGSSEDVTVEEAELLQVALEVTGSSRLATASPAAATTPQERPALRTTHPADVRPAVVPPPAGFDGTDPPEPPGPPGPPDGRPPDGRPEQEPDGGERVAGVTDLDTERARRRTEPTGVTDEEPEESGDGSDDDGGTRALPPWAGSGHATQSQMASLLFAINLWRRFGLDALTEPPSSAWGVVEALGRRLLRGLPSPRRRELLGDPLLRLLADLDGRTDQGPTPVRLGTAMRPVERWLAEHDVPAATFAHPGRILVSRTHVDVVFALDQIDLTARATGLDQDPGWVPELGHIVLFHFEDYR